MFTVSKSGEVDGFHFEEEAAGDTEANAGGGSNTRIWRMMADMRTLRTPPSLETTRLRSKNRR